MRGGLSRRTPWAAPHGPKSAAFRHKVGTRWRARCWYDANVCSLVWMGRSIRGGSVGVRRGGVSCVRSASRRRASSSASPRSCARPMTRVTGRPRAVPRVRSGWRSSRAATTAAPSTSRAPAARCAACRHSMRRSSSGALSLDQVAAAAQYATPDTDAELARIAVGRRRPRSRWRRARSPRPRCRMTRSSTSAAR